MVVISYIVFSLRPFQLSLMFVGKAGAFITMEYLKVA
jgi:hypothetical protein